MTRVTRFIDVPITSAMEQNMSVRIPNRVFVHAMKCADECVAEGGYFTGFSERKQAWDSTVKIDHVTITLYWKEHPHVTFKRHRRSKR